MLDNKEAQQSFDTRTKDFQYIQSNNHTMAATCPLNYLVNTNHNNEGLNIPQNFMDYFKKSCNNNWEGHMDNQKWELCYQRFRNQTNPFHNKVKMKMESKIPYAII